MIQSTLGKVPRHEDFKTYPQGLHPLIYEMATLVDNRQWNEDNNDMFVKMFTDKLKDERDPETLEYYRSINNNRTEKYKGPNSEQDEKDEEEKTMREFAAYKNRNIVKHTRYYGDEEKK